MRSGPVAHRSGQNRSPAISNRMTGLRSRILTSLAIVLTLLTSAACRSQGEYPQQPILLVCPWAVGGGTDRLSRQIAAYLEEDLGVPVNVINNTGGAGVTGHSRGANGRPDGYTVTMMTVEITMLHWRGLTQLTWRDFEPVVMLNQDPSALLVRYEDQRWNDLEDLVADLRSDPGNLTASGTATGGIWHLALAGWLNSIGLGVDSIRWVPMHGSGPALQELLSGGLDVVSCSLPEARIQLANKQVRALGVMAASRSEAFPDVPTFAEIGYDWSLGAWRGLGVPRGTPSEIVSKLAESLERIRSGETRVAGQSFVDFMKREGFHLFWLGPADFASTLDRIDGQLGQLLTQPEFSGLDEGRFRPMDFPLIICGFLGLFLLIVIIKKPVEEDDITPVESFSSRGLVFALSLIGGVAAYVLLAETVGFILTSSVIVFSLLLLYGNRIWTSALVSVLLVPGVYELFANLLRVPLPRGILGW